MALQLVLAKTLALTMGKPVVSWEFSRRERYVEFTSGLMLVVVVVALGVVLLQALLQALLVAVRGVKLIERHLKLLGTDEIGTGEVPSTAVRNIGTRNLLPNDPVPPIVNFLLASG